MAQTPMAPVHRFLAVLPMALLAACRPGAGASAVGDGPTPVSIVSATLTADGATLEVEFDSAVTPSADAANVFRLSRVSSARGRSPCR